MLDIFSSLFGIAFGQFVEVVDNTMLNIALPTISNDLKIIAIINAYIRVLILSIITFFFIIIFLLLRKL